MFKEWNWKNHPATSNIEQDMGEPLHSILLSGGILSSCPVPSWCIMPSWNNEPCPDRLPFCSVPSSWVLHSSGRVLLSRKTASCGTSCCISSSSDMFARCIVPVSGSGKNLSRVVPSGGGPFFCTGFCCFDAVFSFGSLPSSSGTTSGGVPSLGDILSSGNMRSVGRDCPHGPHSHGQPLSFWFSSPTKTAWRQNRTKKETEATPSNTHVGISSSRIQSLCSIHYI